MCYSVLFSDMLPVRKESHTELSLLVPFLADVDGSTDVYLEGKALHNQAQNNKNKATGNNQVVSVRCKHCDLAGAREQFSITLVLFML